MDRAQIERINEMECAMNSVSAAVNELSAALERYREVVPQLQKLEHYYTGPLWMQDYDDDNAGKIPEDVCRGVLSEDAVYDLLCKNRQLLDSVAAIAENTL